MAMQFYEDGTSKEIVVKETPIANFGEEIFLPNYSGVQIAALKTSAPLGAGTNYLTSGSDFIWEIGGTKGVSGSKVVSSTGGFSGSFITAIISGSTFTTDNTIGDSSTSQHGFLPKLGGGTTNFLRADGTWSAPSGGGTVVSGSGTFDPMSTTNFSSTSTSFVETSFSGSITLNQTMNCYGQSSAITTCGADMYVRANFDGTSGAALYQDNANKYIPMGLTAFKNSVGSGVRKMTHDMKVGSLTGTIVANGGAGLVTDSLQIIAIAQ